MCCENYQPGWRFPLYNGYRGFLCWAVHIWFSRGSTRLAWCFIDLGRPRNLERLLLTAVLFQFLDAFCPKLSEMRADIQGVSQQRLSAVSTDSPERGSGAKGKKIGEKIGERMEEKPQGKLEILGRFISKIFRQGRLHTI